MSSLNKVMLIGNLTRDPELRHTPKGTAVAEFGLATSSSYKGRDGETLVEVTYTDIIVWGRQAETCKEYLSQGRAVFVEGRLQFDQWESPQGEKRSRLRVHAERVQFLSSGGGGGGGSRSQSGGEKSYRDRPSAPPPKRDVDPPADEPDDDIPF